MLNLTKIETFFQDQYIFAEIKAFTKKANTQYVCKIKKKIPIYSSFKNNDNVKQLTLS